MFGLNMAVKGNNKNVLLRAWRKDDVAALVNNGFNNASVHRYTNRVFGVTYEDEIEWFEDMRKDRRSVCWAVVPEGLNYPIGITALSSIDHFGSCQSGIVIWDKPHWGQGYASLTHIARTWFAAVKLNRFTIQSTVREPNQASWKALLKVGYIITGRQLKTIPDYGDGWMDTYVLSWLNPTYVNVLYPTGIPAEYEEGVANAANTLNIAKQIVTLV